MLTSPPDDSYVACCLPQILFPTVIIQDMRISSFENSYFLYLCSSSPTALQAPFALLNPRSGQVKPETCV